MQKRAVERIPVNISVRFACSNDEYSGTVSNLSEKGMFICTDNMCFPFDAEFNVVFPVEAELLNLPVKVRRITKTADRYDGIGIELLNLPQKYVDYVASLKDNV